MVLEVLKGKPYITAVRCALAVTNASIIDVLADTTRELFQRIHVPAAL
jgi:hypothetical protein